MATLRTDYQDLAWDGNKKYRMTNNSDGTITLTDVTSYLNKAKSEYNSTHVNTLNSTVNNSVYRVVPSSTLGEIVVTLNDGRAETFKVGAGYGDIPQPVIYSLATTSAAGLMPKLSGNARTFLNGVGAFTDPIVWNNGYYLNMQNQIVSGDSYGRICGPVAIGPDGKQTGAPTAYNRYFPASAKMLYVSFEISGGSMADVRTGGFLPAYNQGKTTTVGYYRSPNYSATFGFRVEDSAISGYKQVAPVLSWCIFYDHGTQYYGPNSGNTFHNYVTYHVAYA